MKPKQPDNKTAKTIAILSSCMDDWGGCEELWARSIPLLQEKGFRLVVTKETINRNHPEYLALSEKGVELKALYQKATRTRRMRNRLVNLTKRIGARAGLPLFKNLKPAEPFSLFLKVHRPDLVIISQAINFDALQYAHQCRLSQTPYVVVSQKAADFYWPDPADRSYMIKSFQNAKKCFFVSHHNLRVTEEQFGIRLNNSQVIFNPIKLPVRPLPFPSVEAGYKLACVGRLFLLDKGQDILLRIMALEKWRTRPVTISFIGAGIDEEGLKAMAALLNLSNVVFTGEVRNIEKLWGEYHALVLPSRSEGLPLVIMEAMAAGRPVIVSSAGGNGELVEEGVTGFMGHANEESFEAAMERAWGSRDDWEMMGKKASCYISQHVPGSPEGEFAKCINEIINE